MEKLSQTPAASKPQYLDLAIRQRPTSEELREVIDLQVAAAIEQVGR